MPTIVHFHCRYYSTKLRNEIDDQECSPNVTTDRLPVRCIDAHQRYSLQYFSSHRQRSSTTVCHTHSPPICMPYMVEVNRQRLTRDFNAIMHSSPTCKP